jgi:hypothetical protein
VTATTRLLVAASLVGPANAVENPKRTEIKLVDDAGERPVFPERARRLLGAAVREAN